MCRAFHLQQFLGPPPLRVRSPRLLQHAPWFKRVLILLWQSPSCSLRPIWIVALENAAVAPFVAASTFIGSMGDIPLATVLNANGVLFAGIMGFIYSDLMVPLLVQVNEKYYRRKLALYIAGTMFVSIVLTALILNAIFAVAGIIPEGRKVISDITQFKLDYTFWMNLAAVVVVITMLFLKKIPADARQCSRP
jgi:uncharacterized protein